MAGVRDANPEQRREWASKGGRAAFEKGVLYRFTPEKAKEAGRKGGLARARNIAARRAATSTDGSR